MDMSSRLLIAHARQILGAPSRSPNGKKILVLTSDHDLVVLDVPSLSNRTRIPPPEDAEPGLVLRLQGMSWTSDNQPIAIWQGHVRYNVTVYTAHDASLVSLYEVKAHMLRTGVASSVCMAVAPGQPYLAMTFHETMGLHCSKAASMLNLKTGQVHVLAQATAVGSSPVMEWHWAPSGLAMVIKYQIEAQVVTNVWHAPSTSFVAPKPMPDLGYSWSPAGDICVLTRRSSIVMVLHIIATGIEVLEAPLGELVPPPRSLDDMPRYVYRGRPSALPCSFTFSQCSRAVIASGGDCIGPLCIKQWRLMLHQGRSERVHLVSEPGEQPELEQPRIRWYPGAHRACVYAIQAGPCTIHIRQGAKAELVASVRMPTDPGDVQELLWDPDGMQLACCITFDQLQCLMIRKFHS